MSEEFELETRVGKRLVIWFIGVLFAISIGAWFLNRTVQVADTAIVRYEEFQEIYNTCQKLNTDLGVIREAPAEDRMFEQFSKTAMVTQKQQSMSRWVEEYNAKSRMWNRVLWKSSTLPYQLSVDEFSNFKGVSR